MMSRSKRVPPDQTTATNDKAKILIVDDRQENILVLMGLLKHVNADFLAAGCGEEALELLLEFDFALAIIDEIDQSTCRINDSRELALTGG